MILNTSHITSTVSIFTSIILNKTVYLNGINFFYRNYAVLKHENEQDK